jgi:ABC-type phosphate transport system substrate-binding protein
MLNFLCMGLRQVIVAFTPFFFFNSTLAGATDSATDIPPDAVFLPGAGATFPVDVYVAWMAAYRSSRLQFVDVRMTYAARGSGYGIAAIGNPQTYNVAYAGSDAALAAADYLKTPDLQMLPSVAGSVCYSV